VHQLVKDEEEGDAGMGVTLYFKCVTKTTGSLLLSASLCWADFLLLVKLLKLLTWLLKY
jgi:hypothetical protein